MIRYIRERSLQVLRRAISKDYDSALCQQTDCIYMDELNKEQTHCCNLTRISDDTLFGDIDNNSNSFT